MANKIRRLRVRFPLGGLNRKRSYRQQAPFTTGNCLNVRAFGTEEDRERGGSRPGLIQSHQDDLGTNVRFLEPMVLAPGDGKTSWSDTFGGAGLAGVWAQASWATDTMSILQQMVSVDTSVADAAIVRDALTIDASAAYTVEALLIPWNGAFHGTYDIYVRLDNTTPAWQTDGVRIRVTMTGSGGVYTGTATSYVGGVLDATAGLTAGVKTMTGGTLTGSTARPVWLIASISSDTITVTLDGTTIMTQAFDAAQNGLRVGLGMETTVAAGVNLCNVFRVQYTSTGTVTPIRSMLTAGCDGNIFNETTYGRMTVVSSSLTTRNDVQLGVAQSGQKLYVADYGDLRATAEDGVIAGAGNDELDSATYADWTTLGIDTDDDVVVLSDCSPSSADGTYKITTVASGMLTLASAPGAATSCTFRIERGPKIYDPVAGTISLWTATAGQVPTGCPLIARHMDRVFLGGADIAPGVWYAPRVGDELDFDYAQVDSRKAVAGTASAAGVPARALTAFAPSSDDYLIMACRESLWRLRGDPAFGGSLDALSQNIGIVDMNAWCWGPTGELIFLSLDGVYILPPGGDSKPISMSREVLPQELLNFNPDTTTINLEYDTHGRGVHIFLTAESTDQRIHWWMDWERKTFWPLTLTADHEPMATCSLQSVAIEDTGVIMGGRDGKLRRPSFLAEDDVGVSFTSYISIGPIPLSVDGSVGTLISLDAVLAEDIGDITWNVYPALTYEATTKVSSFATGTWVGGINGTTHSGGRGAAYLLKLTGTPGRRWALEQIIATSRDAGPRRIS